MRLEAIEYLTLVICNLPVLYFLRSIWRSKDYNVYDRVLLILLWLVHLVFSIVFASYILDRGGDSLGLWDLTADTSQYAQTWMGYFGINTFFIQWVNYLPSKVLGLSFISGTFIYATFSYLGLALLFVSFKQLIQKHSDSLSHPYLLYLPLFSPGLHFWTAGVTKECLLLLGLALLFYSFSIKDRRVLPGILGWAICMMIRPFVGLLFLPLLIWLVIPLFRNSLIKFILLLVGLGWFFFRAIQQFLAYLHLEDFSWDSLMVLSKNQLGFLSNFKPSTSVPMTEMNLWERLVALFFRPFVWESWDFYSFIYSLENAWLVLIIVVSLIPLLKGKLFHIPFVAKYYVVIVLGMFLVFTFTLNNFGLFYRMKSIWMPFLQFPILWLICKASSHLKQSP